MVASSDALELELMSRLKKKMERHQFPGNSEMKKRLGDQNQCLAIEPPQSANRATPEKEAVLFRCAFTPVIRYQGLAGTGASRVAEHLSPSF